MVAQQSCKVPDCQKPAKNAGYCWSHYHRVSRHGAPLAGGPFRGPEFQAARFWSYVEKRGPGECWLWTGGTTGDGYGRFNLRGGASHKNSGAHRFAYEALRGPIPAEVVIDHLCRNRLCINPSHMELVTTQENVRRGRAGQHQARKTHCPQGHPYDLMNTRFHNGSRFCRQCKLLRKVGISLL